MVQNIKLCAQKDCTLCKACVNTCPKDAIITSRDEYGYEKLEIDSQKCVDCGLCSKVCSQRNEVKANTPITCFAAQATDRDKLKLSASGGVFQILARQVLENVRFYSLLHLLSLEDRMLAPDATSETIQNLAKKKIDYDRVY